MVILQSEIWKSINLNFNIFNSELYQCAVVLDWQKLASSCSHFSQILLAHSDIICYQPLAQYVVVEPFQQFNLLLLHHWQKRIY